MRRRPQLNRRDLLQGRLWKLIRPTGPTSAFKPLVMRYPRRLEDVDADADEARPVEDPADPGRRAGIGQTPVGQIPAGPTRSVPRTVAGIAIDPVPATSFDAPSRAPSIPVFRPPGAVTENQFLAGCTRCDDCAKACPHDAIVKLTAKHGAAEGTPTIHADIAACHMCEDFPCISACKPGVLSHSVPKLIGTAKITPHLCLAHHSTTCTVCSERCPVDGVITVIDGKPHLDEDACTGCGVCRYVCPAPENAILLMPTFSRPASNE